MRISSDKLHLAMANACINQYELCDKAKIGRPTLTQLKSGRRNPRPATIGKIAKALNVKVEEIIEQ